MLIFQRLKKYGIANNIKILGNCSTLAITIKFLHVRTVSFWHQSDNKVLIRSIWFIRSGSGYYLDIINKKKHRNGTWTAVEVMLTVSIIC